MVEFTTTDGRTLTFTSGLGFSGRRPRIGGAVPVRYQHDDPERAEIDRASLWMVPAAPPLLAGVGLLVAGVVAVTGEPQVMPAAEEGQVAPTVPDSPEASGTSVTGEPVPMGSPAKVATGRIGDTLTVTDQTGTAQLEITVTRVAFLTGDQATGFYLGVHVEAHALADAQDLFLSARVGGREYSDLWESPGAGSTRSSTLMSCRCTRASESPVGWSWTSPAGTANSCCTTNGPTSSRSGPTDLQAALFLRVIPARRPGFAARRGARLARTRPSWVTWRQADD